MLGGALAVLILGTISPLDALFAINLDVLLFLFGMFVIGEAMEESGYLYVLAHRLFHRATTLDQLVLLLILSFGLLSAILMNDTLAIIGTPLMLHYARKLGIPSKVLLLSLCFAITTGSVLSPIGNPQNLLIAAYSGLDRPFVTFAMYLGLPSLLSLLLVFLLLRWFYRDEFGRPIVSCTEEPLTDPSLASLSRWSLILLLSLILARSLSPLYPPFQAITLPLLAILAAIPILLFHKQRLHLVRSIDWYTLIFFAALFVLMESVWQSGVFQGLFEPGMLASNPTILVVSILVSQFVSNVPFVALVQPLLIYQGMPITSLMALAAGSTLAGNLTILGAASNVIIIQHAEAEGEILTFVEFLKVGLPLTILQILVFAFFLGWS